MEYFRKIGMVPISLPVLLDGPPKIQNPSGRQEKEAMQATTMPCEKRWIFEGLELVVGFLVAEIYVTPPPPYIYLNHTFYRQAGRCFIVPCPPYISSASELGAWSHRFMCHSLRALVEGFSQASVLMICISLFLSEAQGYIQRFPRGFTSRYWSESGLLILHKTAASPTDHFLLLCFISAANVERREVVLNPKTSFFSFPGLARKRSVLNAPLLTSINANGDVLHGHRREHIKPSVDIYLWTQRCLFL